MVMREAPVRACWAIHSMYSLVTSPLGVSRQQIMGENWMRFLSVIVPTFIGEKTCGYLLKLLSKAVTSIKGPWPRQTRW